ncbi:hypothetical protein [Azonexus sp.]|uniref:gp53-like domain-containing protein n=1 Tax=Azonexus sp. TaxID=1872668 RepID=UPI0035B28655
MITESLRNVVVAGGQLPNHEDHTLLLQAIQTIVSNGLPDLSDASETVKGIVMLASVGEAQGLIDAAKAITPATLAAVFGGANRSFSSSDHQQLPSGLIFQWQKTAMISSNSSVSITFPIAFPHECLAVLTTIDYAGTTTHDAYSSGNRSLTGCTIYANGAGGDPAFVLSIGY